MAAATAAIDDAAAAASVAALAAASAGRCGLADGVGVSGKIVEGTCVSRFGHVFSGT